MKKPHMLHHHHTTATLTTTNQILLNKIPLFASSFGKHNFLYYIYNVMFFIWMQKYSLKIKTTT